MKNTKTVTRVVSILVAIMMLALLAMQFMPFWSAKDDSASIQGFIWAPGEHKALEKFFKGEYSDLYESRYVINGFYMMPVIVFICSIAGTVMCLTKPCEWIWYLLPVICGFFGVWGYLSQPMFQLGPNWIIHLVLCIAVAVVGLIGLICNLLSLKSSN